MEIEKPSMIKHIITTVVIALLVGGTSPWWWNELFEKKNNPEEKIIEIKKNEEFTPSLITISSKDIFDSSSAIIDSIPNDVLRIINTMKLSPEWNLEISVHTDNLGDFNENIKLSKERAKNIKEYFLHYNIGIDRIKSEGKGSQNPIAGNNTVDGRELNRRIEFVLSK